MTVRSTIVGVLLVLGSMILFQTVFLLFFAQGQGSVSVITGLVVENPSRSRTLFFGFDISPGQVGKIDTATFTRTGGLVFPGGENEIFSGSTDGSGIVYYGLYMSPAKVVKVNLPNFSRIGSITLQAGENILISSFIDTVHGFVYFATYTSPSILVKIQLSGFTRVGSLVLTGYRPDFQAAVVDSTNTFAYIGVRTLAGPIATILKIRLSDFTTIGTLSLAPSTEVYNLLRDGDFLYAVAGIATPSVLSKIALDSFTVTSTYTFEAGEFHLNTGTIDPSTHKGYFSGFECNTLIEIDLSAMTRLRSLVLPIKPNVAVFDDAENLYLGSYSDSPTLVTKVRISDFDTSTITMQAPENAPYTAFFLAY